VRCYDKKDMAKDHELWDMNLRAQLGKINIIGEIIGLGRNIIDEVFMLY
jgi:hypothetical protein